MIPLNPYTYISGGVAALGIAGAMYYQSTQIHHFHKLYDDANVTIALRDQKIRDMTTAQDTQNKRTEDNVVKVIQSPAPIVKVIQDVKKEPNPANCATPELPDVLKNEI